MESKQLINLRDVSIIYPSGRGSRNAKNKGEVVAMDVNLTLHAGEMLYLIGRVGSGKSSLIKILYAEVPLRVGEGNVMGFDLRRMKRSDIPRLRRRIGVVFQEYHLFTDLDVFDNLHYVMKATGWRGESVIRRRIEDVLNMVGLQDKASKMPFELSCGEQQKLAIARALVNNPKVILADEPTGNLDMASADEIMELFRKIVNSGCSIIMATHNIGNIEQYPSRTVRFNNGRMEEMDMASVLGANM